MALSQVKPGSLGGTWPPYFDRSNSRIRGMATFRIDNGQILRGMLSDLRDARMATVSPHTGRPRATRVTARAFVKNDVLADRIEEVDSPIATEGRRKVVRGDSDFRVEAAFPAERVFPGYTLAYFAFNERRRMPRPESLGAELASVRRITREIEPADPTSVFSRLGERGYRVEHLNGGHTQGDVEQLVALYQRVYQMYTFNITAAAIEGMLSNGNVVLVGRHNGTNAIVSALIAEHCEVVVDGVKVHLYESSDWATAEEHRRKGLITAMQMQATREIRALPYGQSAILWAEVRAAWEAANISARKAGMQLTGTLLKHCTIVSDRSFGERGNRETLHVWVAP